MKSKILGRRGVKGATQPELDDGKKKKEGQRSRNSSSGREEFRPISFCNEIKKGYPHFDLSVGTAAHNLLLEAAAGCDISRDSWSCYRRKGIAAPLCSRYFYFPYLLLLFFLFSYSPAPLFDRSLRDDLDDASLHGRFQARGNAGLKEYVTEKSNYVRFVQPFFYFHLYQTRSRAQKKSLMIRLI